jgi:hypothetical protein
VLPRWHRLLRLPKRRNFGRLPLLQRLQLRVIHLQLHRLPHFQHPGSLPHSLHPLLPPRLVRHLRLPLQLRVIRLQLHRLPHFQHSGSLPHSLLLSLLPPRLLRHLPSRQIRHSSPRPLDRPCSVRSHGRPGWPRYL